MIQKQNSPIRQTGLEIPVPLVIPSATASERISVASEISHPLQQPKLDPTRIPEKQKEEIIKEWKALLGKYDTTRELNAFAEASKTKVSFSQPGIEISDRHLGFSIPGEGRLIFNERDLAKTFHLAKREGKSDEDAGKHVAINFFATFAHELRHQMDGQTVMRRTGSTVFLGNLKEDEVLASALECRLRLEMQKRDPKLSLSTGIETLDRSNAAMVQTYTKDGIDGLMSAMKAPLLSLADSTPQSFPKTLRGILDRQEVLQTENLEKVRRLEKIREVLQGKEERQQIDRALELNPPARIEAQLKAIPEFRKLLDNQKYSDSLYDYYQQRFKEERRLRE